MSFTLNSNDSKRGKPFFDSDLRRCYLAFTWKRCFGRLGKLLCGLALLGIICAAAIYGLSFVNQKTTLQPLLTLTLSSLCPKMQDFITHLHSAWSQTWKAYPRWSQLNKPPLRTKQKPCSIQVRLRQPSLSQKA